MRACHPEERSSGAIADERERFLRDGRQHQPTFLPRRQRLTGLAACTDTAQRIDAGVLRASGTFDGMTGYIRVRWTECGKDPEVRFVDRLTRERIKLRRRT